MYGLRYNHGYVAWDVSCFVHPSGPLLVLEFPCLTVKSRKLIWTTKLTMLITKITVPFLRNAVPERSDDLWRFPTFNNLLGLIVLLFDRAVVFIFQTAYYLSSYERSPRIKTTRAAGKQSLAFMDGVRRGCQWEFVFRLLSARWALVNSTETSTIQCSFPALSEFMIESLKRSWHLVENLEIRV